MRDNEYHFTGPDGATLIVKGSHYIIAMVKAKQRMKLVRPAGSWRGDLATRRFVWDATIATPHFVKA